jgi:hypothetical protein
VDRRILQGSKTRRLGSRVFFEFKHKTLFTKRFQKTIWGRAFLPSNKHAKSLLR